MSSHRIRKISLFLRHLFVASDRYNFQTLYLHHVEVVCHYNIISHKRSLTEFTATPNL